MRGGQSDSGTGLAPTDFGLSCQYHSTPSLMYHRRCIILATDIHCEYGDSMLRPVTLCHNPEDHRMRQLPTCSDSAPR